MFFKTVVFKVFAKFTGKHLCQSLFWNKVAWRRTLFKKRLWSRCFLVSFVKFLRALFKQNISGVQKKKKRSRTELLNFYICDQIPLRYSLPSIILWIYCRDRYLPNYCLNSVQIRSSCLVHIFLCSDWIRRDTSISLYSFQMRENTDKKNLHIWALFTQWTVLI